MKFWAIFKRKNQSKELGEKISVEVIFNAYKTRKEEIESLRKYDRGEKEITPSNLKSIVRSI